MAEITQDELAILEAAAALREAGQLEEALSKVNALIAASPELAVAYNYQGTLYHALSRYAEAILSYQKALDCQSNYLDAYYNLGLVYLKLNRRVEALTVFQAILSLSSTHAGARFQSGRLHMEAGDYQAALPFFHGLVQAFPYHMESHANLATCYLRLGRLEEAVLAYEAVLVLDSKDTQALYNLGVIYSKTGREDLARTFYLKVLALDARHVDAHINLAALYWRAKLKDEAILHYREAQRLRPDDAIIEHALRVLDQDTTLVETTPAYARALFNAYADTYDHHLKEILNYQVPKVFDILLTRYGLNSVYEHVLDLGCGTGLCLSLLRSRAKHLIGVDLSGDMLQKAKMKGGYDELIEGEGLWYLESKNRLFDLVIAADLWVYIGELKPWIAALQRALTSGGHVLFNVEVGPASATGYTLTPAGRFQHDPAYLHVLAQQFGFVVQHEESAVLRTEASKPVMGWVCLWELA